MDRNKKQNRGEKNNWLNRETFGRSQRNQLTNNRQLKGLKKGGAKLPVSEATTNPQKDKCESCKTS